MKNLLLKSAMILVISKLILAAGCSSPDDDLFEKQKQAFSMDNQAEETPDQEVPAKSTEKQAVAATSETPLESELSNTRKKIEIIQNNLKILEAEEERLKREMTFLDTSESRAKTQVKDQISEIDLVIASLEREREMEERKIPLAKKKMEISQKKIEISREEIKLLEDQRMSLLRKNADNQELKDVISSIEQMQDEITAELEKISASETEITLAVRRVDELENRLQRFNQNVLKNFQKREALSDFLTTEKERLQQQQRDLEHQKYLLLSSRDSMEQVINRLAAYSSEAEPEISNNRETEINETNDGQGNGISSTMIFMFLILIVFILTGLYALGKTKKTK